MFERYLSPLLNCLMPENLESHDKDLRSCLGIARKTKIVIKWITQSFDKMFIRNYKNVNELLWNIGIIIEKKTSSC